MQGPFLRKYGTATTIDFVLYKLDGSGLKTDASHASGDVKVMKNEGAEATSTNGFTDEGQTYSIALTATEMEAARITLIVVDQSSPQVWLDTTLVIESYGHASAQHAFDLDTASTAQTGDSYARIGAAGASLTAVPWNSSWDAEVQSECTDALNAYDPPTNTEMIARTLTSATYATASALATVDGNVDAILTDTGTTIPAQISGLNDVSSADVNAACDTAISDASLATAANLATVDSNVDAILTDTGTTLDGKLDTITGYLDTEIAAILAAVDTEVSAILADTGTDGVVLSAATCNKIADHLLRRAFASAAASSDGDTKSFRSLLGAVAKLVNKLYQSSDTLYITEADDSTVLGNQTMSTDADAAPTVGLDTN